MGMCDLYSINISNQFGLDGLKDILPELPWSMALNLDNSLYRYFCQNVIVVLLKIQLKSNRDNEGMGLGTREFQNHNNVVIFPIKFSKIKVSIITVNLFVTASYK